MVIVVLVGVVASLNVVGCMVVIEVGRLQWVMVVDFLKFHQVFGVFVE